MRGPTQTPPSSPSYQVVSQNPHHFIALLKLVTHILNLAFSCYLSGETEKPCTLVLVDDTDHEEDEELRLVLGSPKSESPFGASVGRQNETLLKIKDDADSKSKVNYQ